MSAYKEVTLTITGACALVMHNGNLADPLHLSSKSIAEITAKRKKTDADHLEIGRREFFGSLYLMKGEPCLPAEMIEACIVKGAMKEKRGPAAKAGIIVENNARLEYEGPRTPETLWADLAYRLRVGARVGTSRVIRTRPIFREWAATIVVKYLPTLINPGDVKSFLQRAGEEIGIADWRPRFGRFTVA